MSSQGSLFPWSLGDGCNGAYYLFWRAPFTSCPLSLEVFDNISKETSRNEKEGLTLTGMVIYL